MTKDERDRLREAIQRCRDAGTIVVSITLDEAVALLDAVERAERREEWIQSREQAHLVVHNKDVKRLTDLEACLREMTTNAPTYVCGQHVYCFYCSVEMGSYGMITHKESCPVHRAEGLLKEAKR